MVKAKLNALVLCVLPMMAFAVPFINRERLGPFYLVSRVDPSYAYLTNSLLLSCGSSPHHIDHPGTPLQIFGVLVIGLVRLADFASPVCPVHDVLAGPERYLGAILIAMQLVIAAAMIAFAMRLYRLTGNVFAALSFQVALLASARFASALTIVRPELMIVPAVLLFILFFLPSLFTTEEQQDRDALWAGAFLGLGVAVKLTFLPLALFVLFLKSNRSKRLFLSAAAATFLFWTLTILNSYGRLTKWIVGIAFHDGHYGNGHVGLPALATLMNSAANQILTNATTFAIAALALIIAAVVWRYNRNAAKFLAIGTCALIAQTIITAKHPAEQYMLPTVVVATTMAGVIAGLLGARSMKVAAAFFAVLVICCAPLVLSNYRYFSEVLPATYASDRASFESINALAKRQCEFVIAHDNQSSLGSALVMGNAFANGRFSPQLARLYPDFIEHLADGQFVAFNGASDQPPEVMRGHKVCMVGVTILPNGGLPKARLLASDGIYVLYAYIWS